MTDSLVDTEALDREARRLCRRYVDEIVLAFDLCPWAAPALRAGRVQTVVIHDQFASSMEASRALASARDALVEAARTVTIELVLLVFPRAEIARLEFDVVLRELRGSLVTGGGEAAFALAAFHPDATPDLGSPERAIPFLRRAPDPFFQAVRSDVLAGLEPPETRGTGFVDLADFLALGSLPQPREPLRLRIARRNFQKLHEVGLAAFDAALTDILRDRAATYAKLGLPPRPGEELL